MNVTSVWQINLKRNYESDLNSFITQIQQVKFKCAVNAVGDSNYDLGTRQR